MKQAGLVCVGMGLGIVGMAAMQSGTPKELRTSKLVICDVDGREMVTFFTEEGSSWLTMRSGSNDPITRIQFGALKDGSLSVHMSGRNGQIGLSVGAQGWPRIHLNHHSHSASVQVLGEEDFLFEVAGIQGEPRARLVVDKNGTKLTAFKPGEEVEWTMPVKKTVAP